MLLARRAAVSPVSVHASILGSPGVEQVLDMRLEADEERQLEASAAALLATQARLGL